MRITALSLFLSWLVSLPASALGRPSDAQIKILVTENLRATQSSDLHALLETVHPESAAQASLAGSLDALKTYKLKFDASTVEFLSMAGEYALVRVVQRTTRLAGPDFLDNEIDGVWALRLDGPKWKYWTQMVLKLRPLAQQPKP